MPHPGAVGNARRKFRFLYFKMDLGYGGGRAVLRRSDEVCKMDV